MATIGSLVVNLVANTSQFSSGLKKGAADAKKFEAGIGSMNKLLGQFGVALTGIGATVAAGHFLKGAIKEAMDGEREMAQLAAVIKSTGAAAGFSIKQIDDFAQSLQETTTFSDGATKSAAALLMTFTSIKGDVFKEAIKSAQDMSIAMGSDLNGSIIQLGKALNDPIKGISALSKVGVSFTDDQKKLIKGFVEANDVMSAQKLILAELAKEFGGSAAAALDTTAGKLEKLRNKWEELKGAIGERSGAGALVDQLDNPSPPGWLKGLTGFVGRIAVGAPVGTEEAFNANDARMAKERAELEKWQAERARLSVFKMDETSSFDKPLAAGVAKRFGKMLDVAFDAQFVGTNRADMFKNAREFEAKSKAARMKEFGQLFNMGLGQLGGSANLAAFASMRDRVNGKPKAASDYRPLEALERGSSAAFSAILQSKSSPAVAFHETAKKQLAVQQQIATNTAKAGAATNVVTIGAA